MGAEIDERRERVLEALVRAGEGGVSGQVLADELGCSRAAIHRHVEALRRAGLAIDGVHDGYRLAPGADPVAPGLVREALVAPILGPVIWSPRTGSTNDDAVAAARTGAAEGLVVGADFQEVGRGRRGRDWLAAPGDALLFSVLLRPQVPTAEVGVLPIVAAVAVAEAIGHRAGIVWPNDILVGDRKVCGILCELSADETGVAWVVVGIGVNVRAAPSVEDGRWTAGAVADARPGIRRPDLLTAILIGLADRYREWLASGSAPVLAAFADRDLLRGSGLTVRIGEHEASGTANGVDELGRLRLTTAGGELTVGSGEVTRVERGPG
jgi:BirA family biotin operon repressor/biotin-[acetyl-CoA-carboxylase] ligase